MSHVHVGLEQQKLPFTKVVPISESTLRYLTDRGNVIEIGTSYEKTAVDSYGNTSEK